MVKVKKSRGNKKNSKSHNDYDDGIDEKQHFNQPFESPGSDDDYTQEEKILLDDFRSQNRRSRPTKHAIMDLPSDDDDDDDDDDDEVEDSNRVNKSIKKSSYVDSDDLDSDIEGKETDEFGDLPNQKAWGKSRKNFYSTDYVDQDYGGFDGDDAELAELEEKEAREIQQRLVAELEDNDFTLDVFTKGDKADSKAKVLSEVIKTDLSQMTSKQKLSLLQQEAPELLGITNEFKDIMSDVLTRLRPAMKLIQEGRVVSPELVRYIRTKYYLSNNYALNMGFYLLLRARRLPVAAHPVVKRLLQYRQLLSKLEPVESIASFKIDELLNAQMQTDSMSSNTKKNLSKELKTPKLKLLSSVKSIIKEKKKKKAIVSYEEESDSIDEESHKQSKDGEEKIESSQKPSKVSKAMPWQNDSEDEESTADMPWNAENMDGKKESEDGKSKRAITWEMAKNKGLTARRKKEDRNPRVKHRNKFRKAKIRRKGQVREPRKELQRYGGELSGIKATISKSIKLK